mmetsp:Transcript_96070/g.242089  ORF Transcript_96070/g.242089 Transcript_96070/m.242089 type:complete len:236 (+) Transcript_96070:191-898(+)
MLVPWRKRAPPRSVSASGRGPSRLGQTLAGLLQQVAALLQARDVGAIDGLEDPSWLHAKLRGLGVLVDVTHDDLLLILGRRHASATNASAATRKAQGLSLEPNALHRALAVIELDSHGSRHACHNGCRGVSHSVQSISCALFHIGHHFGSLIHDIARLLLHLLGATLHGVSHLFSDLLHRVLDVLCNVLCLLHGSLRLRLDCLSDLLHLLAHVLHPRLELLLLLLRAENTTHRFG